MDLWMDPVQGGGTWESHSCKTSLFHPFPSHPALSLFTPPMESLDRLHRLLCAMDGVWHTYPGEMISLGAVLRSARSPRASMDVCRTAAEGPTAWTVNLNEDDEDDDSLEVLSTENASPCAAALLVGTLRPPLAKEIVDEARCASLDVFVKGVGAVDEALVRRMFERFGVAVPDSIKFV
jgi:hypothetical protein